MSFTRTVVRRCLKLVMGAEMVFACGVEVARPGRNLGSGTSRVGYVLNTLVPIYAICRALSVSAVRKEQRLADFCGCEVGWGCL